MQRSCDHTATDSVLLEHIARGDRAAMRVFYERHHSAAQAFLRSRGASGEEADDALHDAMIAVWRTAANFKGTASARTWLFSIARNKFIDRTRKTTRLDFVETVPDQADEAPDPEAQLMAASDAARVRACLSKLKPAHQTVLRLAFFEDLNLSEIAELEAVPEGTVKSRIFHAKKLLMNCLGRR